MTVGETVWLQRPSEDVPWGFRLSGGRDYKEPIKIQRVTVGTIASRDLSVGDLVLRIGHEDTGHLTQAQANELVKHCGNTLQLCISKCAGAPSAGPGTGSYSQYAPHTPGTPGTPGQVATQGRVLRPAGDVHDLFDDMYRQSDQSQQHNVQSNRSQPYTPYNQNQTPNIQRSPQVYEPTTNGGIARVNNDTIGPFFPGDKEHNFTNNSHQNLKRETSLNSSIDSGISAPASQKMGSPSYHNTPASVTSSTSELSDSYNQSLDSLPSPPPQINHSQFTPTSPSIQSSSLPSPPPPLPSSEPPSWTPVSPSANNTNESPRTRLEQQLAELNVSGYMSPTQSYPNTPQSYHSPNTAPGAPGYHPLAGVPPPPPPAPPAGGFTNSRPYNGMTGSPRERPQPPQVADKPQMPDKVMNMAAKSGSDKKPFSYAPDVGSLAEQREKVRRRSGQKEQPDITQSETYKMIHGIDEPKKRPTVTIPNHTQQRHQRGPTSDDEMTFSGVNRPPAEIPSKAFQRLQNMTGGAEIDTTSIRPKHDGEDDGVIGGYDEASIRYMGRNIPSKSFRMLQNLTGGPDMGQPMGMMQQPKRRPVRKQEPNEAGTEQGKDDYASMSYVGGNIPSKSFKMLQQSIGEPESTPSPPPGSNSSTQGRQVKIIKLRTSAPQPSHAGDGATDF